MGFWENNKQYVSSMATFAILMLVVSFVFPPTIDDVDSPKLLDKGTGIEVYKKVINIAWFLGMFAAGLVAIYVYGTFKQKDDIPITRPFHEAYLDILDEEVYKFGLPSIKDIDLSQPISYLLPSSSTEPYVYKVRFPDYDRGIMCNLLIDLGVDYKTRRKSTLISYMRHAISPERVDTVLYKGRTAYARSVRDAEKIGFTREEIMKRISEKAEQSQEEAAKATEES